MGNIFTRDGGPNIGSDSQAKVVVSLEFSKKNAAFSVGRKFGELSSMARLTT